MTAHDFRLPAAFGIALLHAACTAARSDEDPTPEAPIASSCAQPMVCATNAGCCDSIWLPGGSYLMGFSPHEVPYPATLADEDLDHRVQIGGYFLDRFEISRARFAAYVANYSGPPAPGSGAHPWLEGSGWQSEWDSELPADPSALLAPAANAGDASQSLGSDAPMASLSWFLAYAFCIWDGGRLPTEAEWEYAAAGGPANLAYPWGDTAEPLVATKSAPLAAVGSNPSIRGRFGHDDLAGGVEEWVLDWYSERYYLEGGANCHDCANLVQGVGRGVRGARDQTCCTGLDTQFRSAARYLRAPGAKVSTQGARCAREGPR